MEIRTEKVPSSYYELVKRGLNHTCDHSEGEYCVHVVSAAYLPSRFGEFTAIAFDYDLDEKEHAAFVKGDVVGKENVLLRLHSECLTGDAIGSLKCDCRDQLEGGLRLIEEEGEGVVLYLRQEGRGIGLTNKLRAYSLQDQGLNTVEANRKLGFRDDERDYKLASELINALGIKSVRLLTNNPNKISQLQKFGINVVERVGHSFPSNQYNREYLKTKKKVSGHLIEDSTLLL